MLPHAPVIRTVPRLLFDQPRKQFVLKLVVIVVILVVIVIVIVILIISRHRGRRRSVGWSGSSSRSTRAGLVGS